MSDEATIKLDARFFSEILLMPDGSSREIVPLERVERWLAQKDGQIAALRAAAAECVKILPAMWSHAEPIPETMTHTNCAQAYRLLRAALGETQSSACTSTAGPGPQAGKPGAEPGTSATSAGVDRDRVLRAIRALGLIKCETIDDVRALSDVITSLSDACWDSVVPPNRAGLRGQCDCE